MMPVMKSDQYYVHLGSGLYLAPDGKLVDTLPKTNYIVEQLPYPVVQSDFIKKTLTNVDINKVNQAILDAAPLLAPFGVQPKTVAIIGACIQLALALTSVVGAIGAASNLLKVLGLFDSPAAPDNRLAEIQRLVQEVHTALFGFVKHDLLWKVETQRSSVTPALQAMKTLLEHDQPGPMEFEGLRAAMRTLVSARVVLLKHEAHQTVFDRAVFDPQPWFGYRDWLEPRPGTHLDPREDIRRLSTGDWRWDYTPYLAAVVEISTVLIACCKSIDPALRTSQQFQEWMQELASDLERFAHEMMTRILWTRTYTQIDDDRGIYPMAYGWPVGAVDSCSGNSALTPYWNDGVMSFPPAEAGPHHVTFDPPPTVLNREEALARASQKREADWLSVFAASGAPKVLHLAAVARELSTIPEISETVTLDSAGKIRRSFIGSEKHLSPPISFSEQREFPCSVYRVERKLNVQGTLQPSRFAEYYKIPYRFYIEAHEVTQSFDARPDSVALSRHQIDVGQGSLSFEASTFDWEVQLVDGNEERIDRRLSELLANLRVSERTRRGLRSARWRSPTPSNVKVGPAGIHVTGDDETRGTPRNIATGRVCIDYALTVEDGGFRFQCSNRSGTEPACTPAATAVNFAGVFFVVEEMPKHQPTPIRTVQDIGMVGLEHHLPKEYYEYIHLSEARARDLLNEVDLQFNGRPTPPTPGDFDLLRNGGEWVRRAIASNPGRLPATLIHEMGLDR